MASSLILDVCEEGILEVVPVARGACDEGVVVVVRGGGLGAVDVQHSSGQRPK